jgi:hypothetical protein
VSELPRANVRVFRVVAGAWLLGWFWKAGFYGPYYLSEIWAYPYHYDGLPRFLVHPALATIAWLAPVVALGALAYPRTWTVRAAAVVMTAAAFTACLHFETCNDATFVTSFWVGLWLCWFSANARRTDAAFHLHARVLAQCTVALVFLGGVVGKLTGAYVTGEALYQLYFMQKHSWPYTWLREAVSPDALRVIATWFSRAAMAAELALAVSPILPVRIAAIGSIAVMTGMVIVSTWYLLSVMACLIGLMVAVLLLRDDNA